MDLQTAYRTLGLTPPVDWKRARTAWRAAAGRLHPDRGGDAERFGQAKMAWETIDAALSDTTSTTPPTSTPDLNLGTPLVLRELRLDGLRMPAKGTARLTLCGHEVLLQVDLETPISRLGSWFEASLLHAGVALASLRGPIVSSSQTRPRPGVPSAVTAFWVRPVFGSR